ncbi:hypothetical protein B7R54_17400 [Subtercola boreus]|uniref:Uncharacterized protein n=1 Tax=Subtercola boreus TaxID=120213 RepID=A0A3E0VLD8_9MICO|nr:hypothetical protein [Subtercola boreus]RFA10782.1 hypothetical protein B7R54_17400 [Subtercola boreus]TQL55644.1 hypothetical protein FB464_3213 [Subtercola boreus]
MRNPIICLTCLVTYPTYQDSRLIWQTAEGKKGTPPPFIRNHRDRALRREWLENGFLLHCEQGHLMPGTNARQNELLVLSLFGEKAAGKGALLRGMERQLSAGQLRTRGIRGAVRKDQEKRFDLEYPDLNLESTNRATRGTPRVPIYFDLTASGPEAIASVASMKRDIDLAVFDTAWEDQQTVSDAATSAPFIPETDVLVFVVPPGSLDGLPETVRKRDGEQDLHDPKTTERGMSTVVAHMRDRDLTTSEAQSRVTVIIALSKCDRYQELPGFPQDLLRDRDYTPDSTSSIGEQMAAEQAGLNAFMIGAGGLRFLDTAAQINGTVSIHAISGTGSDTGNQGPAQITAPNRSLDPLALGLLRAGVGDFGAAPGW